MTMRRMLYPQLIARCAVDVFLDKNMLHLIERVKPKKTHEDMLEERISRCISMSMCLICVPDHPWSVYCTYTKLLVVKSTYKHMRV